MKWYFIWQIIWKEWSEALLVGKKKLKTESWNTFAFAMICQKAVMTEFQTFPALDFQSHFLNIFQRQNQSPAYAESFAIWLRDTAPGKMKSRIFLVRQIFILSSHWFDWLIDCVRASDVMPHFGHVVLTTSHSCISPPSVPGVTDLIFDFPPFESAVFNLTSAGNKQLRCVRNSEGVTIISARPSYW